ncbi:MAG: hypothetical protein KBS95_04790 [Alistipes sp.]|nr:hypothetical protein [Candidatus Alistipes equi]
MRHTFTIILLILSVCISTARSKQSLHKYNDLSSCVVVCGDSTLRIIDLKNSSGSDVKVIWQWKTSDKDLIPLDECKPFDRGRKIMISSSRRAIGILSVQTGELIAKAKTRMAHSVEMLPGNRIAAALSTNKAGNCLVVYDLKDMSKPFFKDSLYSGHGVVWNKKLKSLFALGYTELREYKLKDWNSKNPSLELKRTWLLPGKGGHDLSWVDYNRMLITNAFGVYMFDIAKGEFSPFEPMKDMRKVKSVNYDSKSGLIVYTQGEEDWWTHHVNQKNPDKRIDIPDFNAYKVRTFLHNR